MKKILFALILVSMTTVINQSFSSYSSKYLQSSSTTKKPIPPTRTPTPAYTQPVRTSPPTTRQSASQTPPPKRTTDTYGNPKSTFKFSDIIWVPIYGLITFIQWIMGSDERIAAK
jgi:hypothetical protein